MPVLAVSIHAARWDLVDAMRAAGVDTALLDAYDEVRAHEDDVDSMIEAACERGYEEGFAAGERAAKAAMRKKAKTGVKP